MIQSDERIPRPDEPFSRGRRAKLCCAMKRFIEWDSIDVRVDGAKINAMAREMVASDPMIERLELDVLGNIANWPREFFGDPMHESAEMLRAQMKRASTA